MSTANTSRPHREQQRLLRLVTESSKYLHEVIALLESIIFEYGTADALIDDDYSGGLVLHDYALYCITKSCKSLIAVQLLLSAKLPEDAMSLLRSVYENYLHIAYVLRHPTEINEFVWKKMALKVGKLEHVISAKGRRLTNRVRDVETGEEMTFGIGASALAEGTPYATDAVLHLMLHTYLSEHTHPNMLASGNYRDDLYYTPRSSINILQAALFASYLSTIVIAETLRIQRMVETPYVKRLCRTGIRLLRRIVAAMEFPNEFAPFPDALERRLTEMKEYLAKRSLYYLKPYRPSKDVA